MENKEKYKVFIDSESDEYKKYFPGAQEVALTFFEDCFIFTNDLNSADIIPLSFNLNSDKKTAECAVILSKYDLTKKIIVDISCLYHVHENLNIQLKYRFDYITKNLLDPFHKLQGYKPAFMMLQCHNQTPQKNIFYIDFYWNMHISTYVEQPNHLFFHLPVTKNSYTLPLLDREKHSTYINSDLIKHKENSLKAFLSLSSIKYPESLFVEYTGFAKEISESSKEVNYNTYSNDRLKCDLINLLEKYPGFIGNNAVHSVVIGQNMTEENIDKSISGIDYCFRAPAHNAYYEYSVISIYIEDITFGPQCRCITEKTWEPLIKGHFILPFGYTGMINELINYGFLFPEWIDYSYDSETNDLLRWIKYIDEVRRVLSIPCKHLHENKILDMNILEHNRNIFFELNYKNYVSSAIKQYIKDNSPKNSSELKNTSVDNIIVNNSPTDNNSFLENLKAKLSIN